MNTYYVYREITSKLELETFFSLRYEVFNSGDLSGLIKKVDCGLDIDNHDLRARHYGVYKVGQKGEVLVGGHRLIFESEMPIANNIREIISTNFGDQASFCQSPESPFYMFQLSPYKTQMLEYYKELKTSGKRILESSRFFLHPKERSIRLLEFVGLAALSLAFYIHSTDYGITSCNRILARFNKRFGFKLYPNTGNKFYQGLELCNLIISKNQIPSQVKTKLEKMKSVYLAEQQVYHYPGLPAYYGPSHISKSPFTEENIVSAA